MDKQQMFNQIQDRFATLRAQGRTALIPYLTAGDPTLVDTEAIVLAAAEAGADVIELGIPFTDSIADGPVIQQAFARALASGTTPEGVLALAKRLQKRCPIPICLMGSINLPYALGLTYFFKLCEQSGVDGLILPDLPKEEWSLIQPYLATGPALIPLMAPTSNDARIRAAAHISRGFLYLISRTGTTGVQKNLPPDLTSFLKRCRRLAPHTPLAVGFGISTPDQARQVGTHADGVIIGSALVRKIAAAKQRAGRIHAAQTFIHSVRRALDQGS